MGSIPHDCPAVAALPEELREQLIDASRRRPIVVDRGGRAWETGIDVLLPSTRPLMHKPWPRIGRGEEERIVVCVAMRQQGTTLPIYEWTFNPEGLRLHTGSGITEPPMRRRDLLDLLELRRSGGKRKAMSQKEARRLLLELADQADNEGFALDPNTLSQYSTRRPRAISNWLNRAGWRIEELRIQLQRYRKRQSARKTD
jgi:hypothetical protein